MASGENSITGEDLEPLYSNYHVIFTYCFEVQCQPNALTVTGNSGGEMADAERTTALQLVNQIKV